MTVDFLAATVVYTVPYLRNVGNWLGGRDVSPASIGHAIKSGRSVILIPGGQAEMRLSKSEDPKIQIVTRHKGFVRLALQHGVPLVPVLSLGEVQLLDNVRMPRVQSYFLRKVGFNFPLFPFGRWLLPVPRAHKIALLVGHPLELPKIEQPTQEQIDHYHSIYFTQLNELTENYKIQAGFHDTSLEFTTH